MLDRNGFPRQGSRPCLLARGGVLDAQDCDLPGRDFNGANEENDSDRYGDFLHAVRGKGDHAERSGGQQAASERIVADSISQAVCFIVRSFHPLYAGTGGTCPRLAGPFHKAGSKSCVLSAAETIVLWCNQGPFISVTTEKRMTARQCERNRDRARASAAFPLFGEDDPIRLFCVHRSRLKKRGHVYRVSASRLAKSNFRYTHPPKMPMRPIKTEFCTPLLRWSAQ